MAVSQLSEISNSYNAPSFPDFSAGGVNPFNSPYNFSGVDEVRYRQINKSNDSLMAVAVFGGAVLLAYVFKVGG